MLIPIHEDNTIYPEKGEEFWSQLEKGLFHAPDNCVKTLMDDFKARVGKERKYRKIVGKYSGHQTTNKNRERLIDVCKSFGI